MSGEKRSQYELQQQRERKLQAVRRCAALQSQIAGLRQRLEAALSGASEGLRTTFAQQVQQARAWL